jgi:hypothetical protein
VQWEEVLEEVLQLVVVRGLLLLKMLDPIKSFFM